MKQQVYHLKEFAARHHLESIFGAYAAHIYIDDLCENEFKEMALERTLFTKLILAWETSQMKLSFSCPQDPKVALSEALGS